MSFPHHMDRDYLAGQDGQAALRSLTAVERMLCGRLIARQFANWAKIPRVVNDYGLEGAVRLCSARALQPYLLVVGVIGVAFSVAGTGAAAAAVFVLFLVLAAAATARLVSAVRSGRRWREGRK
jgi:hypothetical protein